MSLFVGRLTVGTTVRDLEGLFSKYGRLLRCDVKRGRDLDFGFVDFEDKRDSEDALRSLNGATLMGSRITVEWARGGAPRVDSDKCFQCGAPGHFARDCPNRGSGYRSYGGSSSSYSDRDRDRDRRRRSRSRSRSRSPRRDRSRERSPRRDRSRSRSRDRSPPRRERSKDNTTATNPAAAPAAAPVPQQQQGENPPMQQDDVKQRSRSRSNSPRR